MCHSSLMSSDSWSILTHSICNLQFSFFNLQFPLPLLPATPISVSGPEEDLLCEISCLASIAALNPPKSSSSTLATAKSSPPQLKSTTCSPIFRPAQKNSILTLGATPSPAASV